MRLRAPGALPLNAVLGGRLKSGAGGMRAAMVAALLFAVVSPASANKRPLQAKLSDLATVWIGGDAASLEFFRLELDQEGCGLLTVQWLPKQAALAYKVVATRLSGYRVDFVLEAVDRVEESLYLRGTALPTLLELEVGAEQPKWKRKLAMEPYSKFEMRLKAVSDRAGAFR